MSPNSGWYQDPRDATKERYFNGHTWTQHVRNDVPKIPLAPWVDPEHHRQTGGVIRDLTPPRSETAMWRSVLLAAIGVGVVTVIGVSATISGLRL